VLPIAFALSCGQWAIRTDLIVAHSADREAIQLGGVLSCQQLTYQRFKLLRFSRRQHFFQMPGADSAINIEGLPFVDYLWKLWSPAFKNDEHLRSIKETLSSPGTMTAALKYYGGLTDAGRTGRLPMNEMHTPTLTIYGSNDPTAKYSVKEEPLFKGPHKRVVLPHVGHFPHLECETEVTGLIMDWFKAHASD
jgi:pimeloyl-ACP methyl ester carboxylesterase